MALPDRDVATGWVGKVVVDRDGAEIGLCTALVVDEATGLPVWLCADLDQVTVPVPVVEAAEMGGQVRVAVSRIDVTSAPSVGDTRHLSRAEQAALYRHYRMEHSPAASERLLPAGEAEPPASGFPSDPAAVTAEPASTPAASGDLVSPPRSEPSVVPPPDKTAPVKRGRRLTVVFGVLAGLGAILATVLRVRRLGARPPTPAERAAQRARAVSVAARARTGQIAASAAPIEATTRQVVRRGTRAGAGSAQHAANATTRLVAVAASRAAGGAAAAGQRSLRGGRRAGGAVASIPEVVSERSQRLQKGWRRVMGKLTAGLSFGAGYVLGTRAGRERFQQLKQAAVTVAQRPEVQQARERLKTAATGRLQSGTGGLTQQTAWVTGKLRRRPTSTDPASGAQTPPPPLPDAGMAAGSPSQPGGAPEPLGTPPQAGDEPDDSLR